MKETVDVIDLDSFNNDLLRSRSFRRKLKRQYAKESKRTERLFKLRKRKTRGRPIWEMKSPRAKAIEMAFRKSRERTAKMWHTLKGIKGRRYKLPSQKTRSLYLKQGWSMRGL